MFKIWGLGFTVQGLQGLMLALCDYSDISVSDDSRTRKMFHVWDATDSQLLDPNP